MTWCVIDLETQNYEYRGSLASPHDPRNYIVASGWCIDNQPVQYEYYRTPEEAVSSDWLERALKDQQVLVAFNATFEIHWLMHYYKDTLMAFLKRGGRIYCPQLAEFLLTHQLELYPRLEDTAVKYGGTKKVDEVKLLWQAGYKTSEIDEALLIEYLADEHCGDVANTRLVCFKQVAEAKRRGMYEMMQMRMDGLLFNAIATYNGLYVNAEIAAANQKEQEARIVEIKASILDDLPSDLPEELNFSFTSGYHMSAFLYGGTVKYDKKVSYDPVKYDQVEAYEWTDPVDGHTELHPIADFTELSNITVFKSGKNKGIPKIFKIDSDVEKLKWGTGEYTFKGLIDLNALPDVAKEQFLGKRADFRGARNLVCGTPVYSTSKDALTLLQVHGMTQANALIELAALEKDTGTYYLRTDASGKQSGMLQFVEPTGIIHHQLNACATVTTRLSGSRPNLQNLPRDGTSKVKSMFTSRFGTSGRIVEVDYTALEVVTLASIADDDNLLEQLIKGTDMHCYRLAFKLGEPYEEVYKKCHDKSHPEHKQYKDLRTAIKTPSFADQYGASEYGVAYAAGCSVEFAREFQENEAKLFPQAKAYASTVVRPAVEATGLLAPMEREMNERSEWKVFRRGYFQAKGGTCYSFRQYPKYIDGREFYDYKDTQIANYWCQGEASFIVQVACGRTLRWLLENDFFDGQAIPINTVHDAIYEDCATEELGKLVGVKTSEIMASTPAWMAERIPAYKEWRYHSTPFPAAAEMGTDMMNKVAIN